jgi:hypothetical protein
VGCFPIAQASQSQTEHRKVDDAMPMIRYEADLMLRKDRSATLQQLHQNLKLDTAYTVTLIDKDDGKLRLSVSSECEIDRDALIEAGGVFKIAREYWKFTNELG